MVNAIEIKGLSKQYQLGGAEAGYRTLREAVSGALRAPFRRLRRLRGETQETPRIWALREVSFEVPQGQVVGIIGPNGAGKTTLLKILSRITEPTEGRVVTRGRVASLLEVGTGFHPELTGRENVFLNGAILGMRRAEIERKFDEIVAFAEIEPFLDTPVKRYSSGMYVRLAFAVAAHLEPEILVVDEVLAVGDVAFQKKCLGKMGEVAGEGRTVLFVSHNMAAINRFCNRCVLLRGGRLQLDDKPARAIESYLGMSTAAEGERLWPSADTGAGHGAALRALRCRHGDGRVAASFGTTDDIHIETAIEVFQTFDDLALAIRIMTQDGTTLIHTANLADGRRELTPGTWRTACTIPAGMLNRGHFSISVGADIPMQEMLFRVDDALGFSVESTQAAFGRYPAEAWQGLLSPAAVAWGDWRPSADDAS